MHAGGIRINYKAMTVSSNINTCVFDYQAHQLRAREIINLKKRSLSWSKHSFGASPDTGIYTLWEFIS